MEIFFEKHAYWEAGNKKMFGIFTWLKPAIDGQNQGWF